MRPVLHSHCPPARLGVVRRIGDLDVLAMPRRDALLLVRNAVVSRAPEVFAFCNAHTVNLARSSANFADVLRRTTILNDGLGVDIAGLILYKSKFPANLNGTDFTPLLLDMLPKDTAVFLLGSVPGVADRAREVLEERNPALRFVGTHHGYFDAADEPAVVETIRASGASLVLVGMGHPLQEEWAVRNVDRLGAPVMCIGAFLDFTAGEVSRAPSWMRAARAEWMYRLYTEPRRMAGRYLLGNVTFLVAIIRQRFASPRS